MSDENHVICCLPEQTFKLICDTLRLDGQSKAFDHEFRRSISEAAEIMTNSGRYIPDINLTQGLLPDGLLNDMLTLQYLDHLTDTVSPQVLAWNKEAIAEVKRAATEALMKHYNIQLPSDHPKDILLRQASITTSVEAIVELGFVYERKLLDGGWDVDEEVDVWRHPDSICILAADFEGKFTYLGEKNKEVIRELVHINRLGRFMREGDFVLPQKGDNDESDGIMGFVWDHLTLDVLSAFLSKEHPEYHVYTLITTSNGHKIVPGNRTTDRIGYILTRNPVFIDNGIEISTF